MSVPAALTDLGITAVALFLFVAAIYLILRIVQAVKGAKTNGDLKNGHPRCFASPVVTQLVSNQLLNLKMLEKIQTTDENLLRNMDLQTALMERMVAVTEKMSDLLVRTEARETR